MVETNNKKLFNLVMDKRFETGEYNFETAYGSVKLVKTWSVSSSKDSVDKVDLYLNDELILTLKNCNSWFDPFTYETLYAHVGENKIELCNDLQSDEDNLTIKASTPNSDFLIQELKHNRFKAIKDDIFFKKFEVQLIDKELCGENINYHIDDGTKDFLVHIDDGTAMKVPINPNSTAAEEVQRLKDKFAEAKRRDTLGLLIETIFKKYEFEEDFDVELLDMEEKALKDIADFYNKYHVNKEEIFEKLDSNPVFKEVEKYVEKILQEHELAIAQEKVDKIQKRIKELEN